MNVYEILNSLIPYTQIQRNGYIVLRKHQVIPKYYLLSNPNINVLILNYSTGSGKTICGIYFMLMNIYKANMLMLNNLSNIKKPFVIGEWVTVNQFKNDLSRSMFNLSRKTVDKTINFYGYQMLFNSVFPTYYEKSIQDINVLVNDYKNNVLQYNENFLELLRNNVVCVDEIQNLYSGTSLNTYGFTVSFIAKKSREYNIKILLMTGTPFNTSVAEIAPILDLINTKNEFLDYEKFVNINASQIFTIKPSMLPDIQKRIMNNILFFRASSEIKKYKLKHDGKLLVYEYEPLNKSYPREFIIGNKIIDDNLLLYEIPLHGVQLKHFENVKNKLNLNENVDDNKVSIYDAAVNGQNVNNGIYDGNFLLFENIRDYCAVGYELLKLAQTVIKNNEKLVIYHNKIRNFGVLQYAKIFERNGYLMYGTEPKKYTICRNCKKMLSEHTKTSKCTFFQPIYFHCLYGEQKEKERRFIVNELYNNPNNLYGEIITFLFISDVAYAGVSLHSTNNLAVLSRVPSMAKLEQILSRIRRLNSHSKLPIEKRFVRFYIYGIPTVYEYYKYKAESYKQCLTLLNDIEKVSIGNVLFNKPSSYKFNDDEKKELTKLYYNDGREFLGTVVRTFMEHSETLPWNIETFIKLIKDKSVAMSPFDFSLFPTEYIKMVLFNTQNLLLYKYKYNKQDEIFVQRKTNENVSDYKGSLKKLTFNDIHTNYEKIIKDYKHILEHDKSIIKRRSYYNRLLELLDNINDFTSLKGFDVIFNLAFSYFSEYYKTDEFDFFKNHTHSKRNKHCDGLYWKNKIVLRNGTYININYRFIDNKNLTFYKNTRSYFNIVSSNGLHLIIYDFNKLEETEENETFDNRFKIKGIDCLNYRGNLIPKVGSNTIEDCGKYMETLCEDVERLKPTRFIKSPFER